MPITFFNRRKGGGGKQSYGSAPKKRKIVTVFRYNAHVTHKYIMGNVSCDVHFPPHIEAGVFVSSWSDFFSLSLWLCVIWYVFTLSLMYRLL